MARIGVVIPGYGHPQFLAEAIMSACTQQGTDDVQVVVVDDGCRFPETRDNTQALMAVYPGKLQYFRQKNARLPAARNAGVRFLLAAYPDLDFVFFLDADNRLSPTSLAAYRDAFPDDPATGWTYPDIGFFGLSTAQLGYDIRETARDYSPLRHMMGNISEAGSMVRADVFRSGLFFDETMRDGFEDWDFWLSLLEAGYHGRRVAAAGFQYRRRAESMLVDSRRGEDALYDRLRAKHPALFSPQVTQVMAHRHAPDFALICADDPDNVALFSDPKGAPARLSTGQFLAQLQAAYQCPREHSLPRTLLITTNSAWSALTGAGLFCRQMVQVLADHGGKAPAAFSLAVESRVHTVQGRDPASLTPVHGYAVPLQTLLEAGHVDFAAPDMRAVILGVPDMAPAQPLPRGAAADMWRDMAASLQLVATDRHRERRYAGPDMRAVHDLLVRPIAGQEGRPLYPCADTGMRTAFVVRASALVAPLMLEQIMAVADICTRLGSKILLLVEADMLLVHDQMPAALLACIDDLVMVPVFAPAEASGVYAGLDICVDVADQALEDGLVVLKTVGAVLAFAGTQYLRVAGLLRQSAIPTYAVLSPPACGGVALPHSGMHSGGPQGAGYGVYLAYDHAIAGYVRAEGRRADDLGAAGIPAAKITDMDGLYAALEDAAQTVAARRSVLRTSQ